MRRILITLTSLIIATSTLHGQEIKKCDISLLMATHDKVGQLTSKNIKDFLITFGKECQNNVEFSEISNQVLFVVLDEQTDLVIRTMVKVEKELEMDEIINELSSPISDMINVKQLLTKVNHVKIESVLKKKIIDKLKLADENNN